MCALAFRDILRRERDCFGMTSDGISSEDWDKVHEIALAAVNASDEESDRHCERMLDYLRELVSKYGESPSILATQANYVDDPDESERLLLRAFDLAMARDDRSNVLEISLSLADHYASDLLRLGDASRWLEIANAYIGPDSERDRIEYRHIDEAIARLKGGNVISGYEDLVELQSELQSAKRLV